MIGSGYAPVFAKVKHWMTSVIRKDEVEELSRASYAELIEAIKRKAKKVDIDTDDYIVVEGLLKQEGFYFLQSVMRYLTGSMKLFALEWAKLYEVANVKIIARCLLNQKKIDFLYDIGERSKIRKEMVKDLKTLDEFQDFLSRTEYYRIAQDVFPRIKEENKPFYFEISLDNHFAENIKRRAESLGGDKRDVRSMIHYYLEMSRLLWIYRARFNYSLTPTDVAALLPNIFGILSESKFQKLVHAENRETFLALMKGFGFIKDDKAAEGSLEREINKVVLKRVRKALSSAPFSPSIFLAFIVLNQINVKNWIGLIESKVKRTGQARLELATI